MVDAIRETATINTTVSVASKTTETVFSAATIQAGAGEAIYVDRVVSAVLVEANQAAFNDSDLKAVSRVQTGGVSASTDNGFRTTRVLNVNSTNGGFLGANETNATGLDRDIGEYVQDGGSITAEVGADLLNDDADNVSVQVNGKVALIARQIA